MELRVAFVSMEGICKSFQSGSEIIGIMDQFSMQVMQAEHVVIMGPSGSGKTTLVNIIAGLEHPDAGTVTVGGLRIDQMTEAEAIAYRRHHLGFVFQDFGLLEGLTPVENMLLTVDNQNATSKNEALALLSKLNLEDRSNTVCGLLSGGEKQRVAIARALLSKPKLIISDEPTAQLDRLHADQVMSVLQALQTEYQLTLITVTHDPKIAAYADRMIEMPL